MLLHTLKHTHTHTHTLVHCASPFSLCVCLQASVLQRFFPSPTCQQWWIVFPPHPISLCCDWRLESWPNVLRTVSISCWHLAANNESIWGLHLRPLSLLLLPFPKPFFSVQFHLRPLAPPAWHPVSVHQSPRPLTASLPMEWSILLKCRLSQSLLCGRQVMECAISARACCTLGHLHFVLGSCLQLWPSTFHSFTVLLVLR